MATYLETVNRVLRDESVIHGDDDDITSFSDTQHAAAVNLAKRAVKKELVSLVAGDYLLLEEVVGSVTLVTDTRQYALPSDFIQFVDPDPVLVELDSSGLGSNYIPMTSEEELRKTVITYKTDKGNPYVFYFTKFGSTKAIGFHNVPNVGSNDVVMQFHYEKSVIPSLEADTLPFTNDMEDEAFSMAAARHFKYLFSTKDVRAALFPHGVDKDTGILSSRATLHKLMLGKKPSKHYA